MRFSKLNPRVADAFSTYLIAVTVARRSEGFGLLIFFLKALVTSNLAGIFSVLTFVGVLVQSGKQIENLLDPLWLFLVGVAFGAGAIIVFVIFSVQAAEHMTEVSEKFIRDELDFGDLKGLILSKVTGRFIQICILLSGSALVCGVVLAGIRLASFAATVG